VKICRRGHEYDERAKQCVECKRIYNVKRSHKPDVKLRDAQRRKANMEYGVWAQMIQRCTNPKQIGYASYGGRGITVCERWRNYENFIADMGKRPSAKHSIERNNNDGDYEPGNCYWATRFQQGRNRSDNRIITFNGRTQCLKDWATETGMKIATLKNRLDADGWSIERALTERIRGT